MFRYKAFLNWKCNFQSLQVVTSFLHVKKAKFAYFRHHFLQFSLRVLWQLYFLAEVSKDSSMFITDITVIVMLGTLTEQSASTLHKKKHEPVL